MDKLAICLLCFIWCFVAITAYGEPDAFDIGFSTKIPVHKLETSSVMKCSSREFGKSLDQQVKLIKCVPRETIVKLTPHLDNLIFYPTHANVKRCSGACGPHKCLPLKYGNISIHVMSSEVGGSNGQCGIVTVQQETACKCQCAVMERHCTKKQMYVKHECRCKCIDSTGKQRCEKAGLTWDAHKCACMRCDLNKRECSTGDKSCNMCVEAK